MGDLVIFRIYHELYRHIYIYIVEKNVHTRYGHWGWGRGGSPCSGIDENNRYSIIYRDPTTYRIVFFVQQINILNLIKNVNSIFKITEYLYKIVENPFFCLNGIYVILTVIQ